MISEQEIRALTPSQTQALIERLSKHLSSISKVTDGYERYMRLCAKMHLVTDVNFDSSTNKYEGALCRWIIGYQMTKEGYSLSEIGRLMGRSHASIMHGNHRIREILNTSYYYPSEVTLINNFSKQL